ncbi:MAG TPA: uracil-DNA glycosylase [Gammaproteobacteria bacterium]|nr:uracil-DNA glycosylase [Gammaproteobacteria bacterium]
MSRPARRGIDSAAYDPNCRRCPRLAGYLSELEAQHPGYWNRPVAPFGVSAPRLLIVGLAPGRHGANATGRPFTGDFAGLLLYRTLYDLGLASAPESTSAADGLELFACRITNAVKCVPPQNKPTTAEVNTCNAYLAAEIQALPEKAVILALGAIAHRAVLKALGLTGSRFPFAHGAVHALPAGWLVDSYHCSRYNTQTRRLTADMFRAAVAEAHRLATVERR